jgi:hypothetical protein
MPAALTASITSITRCSGTDSSPLTMTAIRVGGGLALARIQGRSRVSDPLHGDPVQQHAAIAGQREDQALGRRVVARLGGHRQAGFQAQRGDDVDADQHEEDQQEHHHVDHRNDLDARATARRIGETTHDAAA